MRHNIETVLEKSIQGNPFWREMRRLISIRFSCTKIRRKEVYSNLIAKYFHPSNKIKKASIFIYTYWQGIHVFFDNFCNFTFHYTQYSSETICYQRFLQRCSRHKTVCILIVDDIPYFHTFCFRQLGFIMPSNIAINQTSFNWLSILQTIWL